MQSMSEFPDFYDKNGLFKRKKHLVGQKLPELNT